MGLLERLVTATRSGVVSFREAWLGSSGPADTGYNSYDARQLRYELSWAVYAGTVYRDAGNQWSQKLRADLGLYNYIRTLFSPATRLVDFHVAHVQGGALDPDAGDGATIPSALPIVLPASNQSNDAALRRAISQLWQNSNWALAKDTYVRWGGAMGDVAIEIVDDAERKKVYMDVVHPSLFTAVEFDRFRNVKSYIREEMRDDPERPRKTIPYREDVDRNGINVRYRTFRDDKPYAWTDLGEEWEEPYGFIPLFFTQHVNVGLDWGWSEFHSLWSKIREADDVGSVLDDQIRKLLNAPWFLSGVRGQSDLTISRPAATPGKPEPGRAEMPMVYGPANSDAKPMVAPMPIGETSAHIDKLLEEIERDRPILRFDRLRASGDASGTALRVARQPAETAVKQLRAGYDDTTVRAQQGAVAIGGMRGYAGFDGFDLDSYAAGALDHRIGDRPVFGVDTMERLDEDARRWEVVQAAHTALGEAGALAALEETGWDAAKIERLRILLQEQRTVATDAFVSMMNQQ